MRNEYDRLNNAFEWDESEFLTLNKIALDAAFCDDNTRAKLAKRLEPTP